MKIFATIFTVLDNKTKITKKKLDVVNINTIN